ncbi:MAG: metal-dependent hydrolase, partial [Acidimicrobiales bacterium]
AMWGTFQSVRLVTHSLLAAVTVMILVLVRTRRGRPRRRWMAVAVGMLLHLFLDAMWDSQETLLWPFLGLGFSEQAYVTVGAYVASVVSSPLVWVFEAIGLGYLAVLARRGGLADRAARRMLLRTGVIEVPIPEG